MNDRESYRRWQDEQRMGELRRRIESCERKAMEEAKAEEESKARLAAMQRVVEEARRTIESRATYLASVKPFELPDEELWAAHWKAIDDMSSALAALDAAGEDGAVNAPRACG